MFEQRKSNEAASKISNDLFFNQLRKSTNILILTVISIILFSTVYTTFVFKNETSVYLLGSLPLFILIFWLNKKEKTFAALTVLFMSVSLTLVIYSIRTGEASFTHMHYINLIIGLSLLYRRNKSKLFYLINLFFTILCVIFVLTSYHYDFFSFFRDTRINPTDQRQLGFVFMIIGSIIFSTVIITSYSSQHKAMQEALDEQKVLLAEVNHRVKNNLAVIVSLLNMQINSTKNEETVEALQDIHNRIMSMALVHLKMYQNKNKSAVELESYINELVIEIRNSVDIKHNIHVETDIDPINIDVSSAIPLGLILNELITNSIKHAFSNERKPIIKIQLKKSIEGHIELIVRDNGCGMPLPLKEESTGLGIGLIMSLTDQIDGKAHFELDQGLVFYLSMPANHTL